MENQTKFWERIETLRKTAYALKEAADIVLGEGQHMEAAAARLDNKKRATAMRER